jgi:DNA recombination protein RmuC
MEPTIILLAALLLVTVLGLAVLLTRARGERERATGLAAELAVARAEAAAGQERSQGELAARVAAETALAVAERRALDLAGERDAAIAARDGALAGEAASRQAVAVMEQRLSDSELRLADFERLKEESLKTMQAAALQTSQALSSKLLEDHKRENEAAKQEGEARVREASAQLLKRFEEVTEQVARIKGEVGAKGEQLDVLWRALTSPGGSGYYAEVGLANTLKSFGLVEGRDYVLQHTAEDAATGRRLRPDAIVFLPGDSVLVVDCKASKFLVEIAAAEGGEGEAIAYQNLARTMNQHLRALAEKDYRNAIAAAFRESGRGGDIARILSVMYLPNEGALEKLHRADPDFVAKATRHQIVPAGPAGLAGFIGFAAVEISLIRQIENQQEIVRGAELLLDSLAIAMAHAASLGKSVKGAADAYEKFAKSVNGRLLSRSRRLAMLGLRPGKALPGNLPVPHVELLDMLIEGEAEELEREGGEIAILVQRAGD